MADICDFCSSAEVVTRFPCRDFDSASKDVGVIYPDAIGPINLVLASHDYWAACAPCAALVDEHDIVGLVKRSMDEYERETGYPHPRRNDLEKHLWKTYWLFFANRVEPVVA